MIAWRAAMVVLLLAPAAALGQEPEDPKDPNKVSNDRPDRPLQMPPASSETREAFDDFERFARRGAWERAFKSLQAIPDDQARRFVDGPDNFIIPVGRKRRLVLADLPPEGRAAFQLFYDADAKKMLDEADGPGEQAALERIVAAYFPTASGDDAADRLGDLHFRAGRFDRAADCWLAVLRDRPETDLSPALLSLKAILALKRAGRSAEVDAVRRELEERFADDRVTIAGREAAAAEHLRRILDADAPAADPSAGDGPGSAEVALPDASPANWQVRFADAVVAGMSPAERIQWEQNPLSGAVPAVAVAGSRLYANYLGHLFAVDLPTGKLLWRSAPFHNVEVAGSQDRARMLDPKRFSIAADGRHVWAVLRDLKDPNYMAPFRLECRRADGGDPAWKSADLPEYAQVELVGAPLLAGGTLFVAARSPMQNQQQPRQQFVLAIRPRDGKRLWQSEVGTFRQSQRYYYYGMGDTTPPPTLAYRSGAVYIDTHAGVLARLDAETGEPEWGYAYPTDPVESMDRFFIVRYQPQEPSSDPSVPIGSDGGLFGKGVKSGRIYALDPDRMARLWDRPLAKSARLLGVDGRSLILGGPELSAVDRESRELLWATRLPGGSAGGAVLVRPGAIWQLTPRGIFEVDPASGRVRKVFRGDDTGSDGGDLHLAGGLLLAVTNRTISAYAVGGAVAGAGASQTGASDD